MLTPEELQAIRERAEKATPGKWRMSKIKNHSPFGDVTFFRVELENPVEHHPRKRRKYAAHSMLEHDAVFVAHARQDIPLLLAEIERLQGIINTMDTSVRGAKCWHCGKLPFVALE